MRYIGNLKSIYRYPVKGMRGQQVDRNLLNWQGLSGDRRFAFMEQGDDQSGFPWLTGREKDRMVLYRPAFIADEVEGPPRIVIVETPGGAQVALDDTRLTEELGKMFGKPPQLVRIKRGCFDSMPVSLISQVTIANIGAEVGMELEERRFRPNLVLELRPGIDFTEDDLLGHLLVFGEADDAPRVRLNRQNARCVMITLNPETGERTPKILKAVAQGRANCAGVYGSTETPGELVEGAPVYLVD